MGRRISEVDYYGTLWVNWRSLGRMLWDILHTPVWSYLNLKHPKLLLTKSSLWPEVWKDVSRTKEEIQYLIYKHSDRFHRHGCNHNDPATKKYLFASCINLSTLETLMFLNNLQSEPSLLLSLISWIFLTYSETNKIYDKAWYE